MRKFKFGDKVRYNGKNGIGAVVFKTNLGLDDEALLVKYLIRGWKK